MINPYTRLQITDHCITLHVLHIVSQVNCGFQIFMCSKELLRVATRRDGFTKILLKLVKPKENHVTHVIIYIYIYIYIYI